MDIIEVKKKIENLKNTDAYYGDDSIKKTIAELLEYIFDNTSQNSMEDSNSKLSEQEKQEIVTLINSSMKTTVVLSGNKRSAVLVKNSDPEKSILITRFCWSGGFNSPRSLSARLKYLGDERYQIVPMQNNNSCAVSFQTISQKGKDLIIECPDDFIWEEGEHIKVHIQFEIV